MMQIRKTTMLAASLGGMLCWSSTAMAHFALILPSDDIVSQEDSKQLQLKAQFLHPLEGQYMELVKPAHWSVMAPNGTKTDLLPAARSEKIRGKGQQQDCTFWQAEYTIKRPGDYTFYLEPTPYWEPAEDSFIVHYTKVCVHALGLEQGWDQPVGLETEIIPKTRPYGIWTGNLFTGQVLRKGKPAADVEVEVEYLNNSADNPAPLQPPSDPFITQVVKTDANGIFSYAMPRTGWWGFAALSTADWTLSHDGEKKPVEIGAVYWVHATTME